MGFMETLRSIRWSRVLIAAMLVIMPVVIFVTFNLLEFEVPWLTDPSLKDLIVKWIAPAIYAFGWVFALVLFATRAADTVSAVATTSKIIPLRMRLFYTANALFLAALFAFPVITPVIAVVSFASLGWRLMTIRMDWDSGSKVNPLTYVICVIFALPAVFCAVIYLPVILSVAFQLWNNVWLNWVNPLYILSMCLATALTFGSLIYFIKTGASEFEQAQETVAATSKNSPFFGVKAFQAVMFVFLLFLYWREVPILDLFFSVGLVIVIFVAIANLVKGRKGQLQMDRSYFVGYLLTAGFFVGDLWQFEESLKSILLVVTAVVYIAIFTWKFFTLEEGDAW